MDKIKVRKVECELSDLVSRIEKLINVSQIANSGTFGIKIKQLCSTLGIKDLEFWEIYFDNKVLFDNKFVIVQNPFNSEIKK
jgi:hypothetical protein